MYRDLEKAEEREPETTEKTMTDFTFTEELGLTDVDIMGFGDID
jgi:hypothetical protein